MQSHNLNLGTATYMNTQKTQQNQGFKADEEEEKEEVVVVDNRKPQETMR